MKKIKVFSLLLILIFSFNSFSSAQPQFETVTNSVGMEMLLLPAGQFIMGSLPDEKDRAHDEFAHEVIISKPFYLASTEVTQGQWKEIMGFENCNFKGDFLPVEKVSWQQAIEFCRKLSDKEEKTYTLPSEAQWEYACRAGSQDSFTGGFELDETGWYFDNSDNTTHAVKTKKANNWGLYDMHGNVAEWCLDNYVCDYPEEPITDPTGPEDGKFKVFRGGAWSHFDRAARCSARSSAPASYQLKYVGFRVIMLAE